MTMTVKENQRDTESQILMILQVKSISALKLSLSSEHYIIYYANSTKVQESNAKKHEKKKKNQTNKNKTKQKNLIKRG